MSRNNFCSTKWKYSITKGVDKIIYQTIFKYLEIYSFSFHLKVCEWLTVPTSNIDFRYKEIVRLSSVITIKSNFFKREKKLSAKAIKMTSVFIQRKFILYFIDASKFQKKVYTWICHFFLSNLNLMRWK